MKTSFLIPLGVVLLLLAGCDTRPISDSGYQSRAGARYRAEPPRYEGELNELDVLGIERKPKITDEGIALTLDGAGHIKIRKGSNVLLMQSGAICPDEPMIVGLSQAVTVTPFSGQPNQFERDTFHKALRLATARGGCETIVCYGGVIGSARQNLDSKAVSWVPLVGSVVPDEHQHMRIRLKVAIVDVRTGNWAMFSPKPFVDQALSARLGRACKSSPARYSSPRSSSSSSSSPR